MPTDPRVDAAIAAAAPFARPILLRLRAAAHAAFPAVEETIKWSRPFFLLDGRPLAYMAAFKAHAAFGLWRGQETGREAEGAGQFGRLASAADLPDEATLVALIRAHAAELPALARPPRASHAEAAPPDDLAALLEADPAARATFDRLPPSGRRDYVVWLTSAKRPETRTRRLAKARELLAAGKDANGVTRP